MLFKADAEVAKSIDAARGGLVVPKIDRDAESEFRLREHSESRRSFWQIEGALSNVAGDGECLLGGERQTCRDCSGFGVGRQMVGGAAGVDVG